jgi:SAM-dependent MidA family methyltransferase
MVKCSSPSKRISDAIRERGPLTVAAFMDLALYDSEIGYYARAARRSGRAGDFFTSVDVGPMFGELLAAQVADMAELLGGRGPTQGESRTPNSEFRCDLVEAGAGDGRLSADILRSLRRARPSVYDSICLHLIEASAAARAAQPATLGDAEERLTSRGPDLPASFEGVLVANELLDAMPVHQVVSRESGLREVYVDVSPRSEADDRVTTGQSMFRTVEGPPSTPALAEYLARAGAALETGALAEINLRAVDWVRDAARRLRRGFMILIDYGHEARDLYSPSHAGGTLTTFARHTMAGAESNGAAPPWLQHPGEHDITAHVDFTSVRAAAEAEGLQTLGLLDQTYFLLGILTADREHLDGPAIDIADPVKTSRALKTLLMPGGLGSTHKVLILGKGVGTPALSGCSYRVRVT